MIRIMVDTSSDYTVEEINRNLPIWATYEPGSTLKIITRAASLEEKIVTMLKTVYDPEIPVNVYDLGLIYDLNIDEEQNVNIDMTLTAPSCPMADFIVEDVEQKVASVEGVKSVKVNLVFEPEWDRSRMSEEALLELGML